MPNPMLLFPLHSVSCAYALPSDCKAAGSVRWVCCSVDPKCLLQVHHAKVLPWVALLEQGRSWGMEPKGKFSGCWECAHSQRDPALVPMRQVASLLWACCHVSCPCRAPKETGPRAIHDWGCRNDEPQIILFSWEADSLRYFVMVTESRTTQSNSTWHFAQCLSFT